MVYLEQLDDPKGSELSDRLAELHAAVLATPNLHIEGLESFPYQSGSQVMHFLRGAGL